jgi:hypothetical protein
MSNSTLEAPEVSPIEYPHLRTPNGTPIGAVLESMGGVKTNVAVASGRDIVVQEESIHVAGNEYANDEDSEALIASWASVPTALWNRMRASDPVWARRYLNEALDHLATDPGQVRVVNGERIAGIIKANQIPFDPEQIVQVAVNVLGDLAPVIDMTATNQAFALDVVTTPQVMPDLGDRRVGDITKAGLRFGLDTARNLAPTVNPYYYRLWCTNGCSSVHEDTKMDARGLTVDDVLVELEAKARLAFSMVESEVEAMYDLRNERVANPERTITRLAAEHGISNRVERAWREGIAAYVEDASDMTMFDIVQSATNLANSDDISAMASRQLQSLGGELLTQHVTRCQSCQSRLD